MPDVLYPMLHRCIAPDVTPMYCARCYTDVLCPMLRPMYCARCYTDVLRPMLHRCIVSDVLYPMLRPMCCTRCVVPDVAPDVVSDVLRPIYARVCRGALPLFRHIAPTGRECNKTQSWGDPGCRSLRSLYPGLRYHCPYRAPRFQNLRMPTRFLPLIFSVIMG